ncbi:hypothetical protein BH18ACT12_BH18ACT12_01400 [soil metagenome]
MSRMTPHLRRLIGLCLLAAAFGLVEVVAIPAATEGQGKKREPPTLLWKSYPLEQRPSATEQADAQIRERPVPPQTSARQDDFLTPALLGGFILLLAAAAIVLKQRSVPIRHGKARQTTDRRPMPRPAQPASVKGRLWRRRRQQHREVITEVVGEPRKQALHPPAPQSAADLLKALQLKAPNPPKLEPTPEVAAVWPEEARKQRQFPETDGPLLESQLGLELWTRIAEVDLVPVPEPSPQKHEESRVAWNEDRVEQSPGSSNQDGSA